MVLDTKNGSIESYNYYWTNSGWCHRCDYYLNYCRTYLNLLLKKLFCYIFMFRSVASVENVNNAANGLEKKRTHVT